MIKIDADALLYIDGREYKKLTPGQWRIDDCTPGKYILKAVYADGKSLTQEVIVEEKTDHEVVFVQEPEPASGSLLVKTKTKGMLYLDDTLLAEIKQGFSSFSNIGTGLHELTLHYADGQKEKVTVEIKKEKQVDVIFTYRPPPAKNYFSIITGFGITFPLEYWGDIMNMGYYPLLSAGYSFGLNWGRPGIFIISGITIESIIPDLEQSYTMFAIPVCLGISYRTNFSVPFYAFTEAAGGAVISFYQYHEEEEQDLNTFTAAPLMIGQVGIGAELFPWLHLSAYFRFSWILFSSVAYYDLSPGVRIEYNIR